MIEAIVEVWCSPIRREDYSIKIIPLFGGDTLAIEDDIKSYVNWTGNFFPDAFGADGSIHKGLWRVVFKVGVEYTTSYGHEGTDYDTEFHFDELFKGQCSSWQEAKYMWLELSGKTDEYFSKPWRKDFVDVKEDEPVAWMQFDGEGGYDFTEDYELAMKWSKVNGKKYSDWLTPLYDRL